jgi:hypothetical protein
MDLPRSRSSSDPSKIRRRAGRGDDSLIVTAKMNDIDPQAWLPDVLARIAEHPAKELDELLPWNWRQINVKNRKAA